MRTSERRSRPRGFTLLEILVVITLVAILLATVTLNIRGADAEQRLKGSAEQLAYRMELARQYALQRNREWGVYVDEASLRFAEFDPDRSGWVEQAQRPFGGALPLGDVTLRVETTVFENLPERDRERLPNVLLFSSGEVTPFDLFLEPGWRGRSWRIHSDGLSRARAEPVDA